MLSFGRDISVSGMDALLAIGEHHLQFVIISVDSLVLILLDLKSDAILNSSYCVVASLRQSWFFVFSNLYYGYAETMSSFSAFFTVLTPEGPNIA
jgi:sulfur relay (sulfurtransferase) DsrF/TusC family protein